MGGFRTVPPMPKPTRTTRWRRLPRWLLLLLALAAVAPASLARPYVESAPARGFHPFTRPKKKNAADQWAYVQTLHQAGKLRAASRQAYALRLYWPNSLEAPAAQLLHARLLEQRRHYLEAFDAYQHLVEQYPGRFEFNEVLERQLALAKTVMDLRKGKFLFLPGFLAPERAIPLLNKIVESAPEWHGAAEALYLVGSANQRIYEYEEAITAYFSTLNRFPGSPFAEKATYNQVQCHIQISKESPQDNRSIETAIAACDFFAQQFPRSGYREEIESTRANLRRQQAQNAFARARYYDKVLKNPVSAIIEYRTFLLQFPDSEFAPAARERVKALSLKKPSAPASKEKP